MISLGLSRISKLLSSTAISWKAIHIAGTNGKGSVANTVSSLLLSSGFSVGRFNSPHLIHRWDCITINQNTVSQAAFLGVEKLIKARNDAEKIDASEFELLTATAFELFSRAEVDIGVIECGMGGRLDATNVLKPEQVLCSVFTKIGMDHEAFLGDTIAKITKEKAGIMKKGVPFVVDQSNEVEVLMMLNEHAEQVHARKGTSYLPASVLQQISKPPSTVVPKPLPEWASPGSKFYVPKFDTAINTSNWALHQQQNLKTALLAWHTLQTDYEVGQKLEQTHRYITPTGQLGTNQIAAIEASRDDWPGRLQLIDTSKITGDQKMMLLDGAHNKQAALALAKYVKEGHRPSGPVVWVIAMSRGKNVIDFASALFDSGDQVVVTQFGPVDGMPWVESEEAERLAQTITNLTKMNVYTEPEPWNALRRASQVASGRADVIICGSLYLVADVLRLLMPEYPAAIEGPAWEAWEQVQQEKLELRKRAPATPPPGPV